MYFDQQVWPIRCEWGAAGIAALAPSCDALVIVDVLSFSTSVDIAVGRGASVYPYPGHDDGLLEFAAQHQAIAASPQRSATAGYSLSPASLQSIPAGTRLVLPSPNGATLTLMTGALPTYAGCLRNAQAVAQAAQSCGLRIGVIAAGERWPDGSLRPAIEDLIGAGAIIAQLRGARSPEAGIALQAFEHSRSSLSMVLRQCSSGQELIGRGFAEDVALAAALNQSRSAPVLRDGAYVKGEIQ